MIEKDFFPSLNLVTFYICCLSTSYTFFWMANILEANCIPFFKSSSISVYLLIWMHNYVVQYKSAIQLKLKLSSIICSIKVSFLPCKEWDGFDGHTVCVSASVFWAQTLRAISIKRRCAFNSCLSLKCFAHSMRRSASRCWRAEWNSIRG